MKWILFLAASAALAQKPAGKPFQAQASSTIQYRVEADHSQVYEINNVSYEVATLVLRKTTRIRDVIEDIGIQANTTVEAWPLGVSLESKPVYKVSVTGQEATTVSNEVFTISRGLEEVAWWSVYNLANGAHLFDTYVPLLRIPGNDASRYAGFEAPPDDSPDARLKAPNVVGVLTYSSNERVVREALITCDDPKRAQLLRSYADSSRTVAYSGRTLKITISQNDPSPRPAVTITVPAGDDLDIAHSQAPAGLHVKAWKR